MTAVQTDNPNSTDEATGPEVTEPVKRTPDQQAALDRANAGFEKLRTNDPQETPAPKKKEAADEGKSAEDEAKTDKDKSAKDKSRQSADPAPLTPRQKEAARQLGITEDTVLAMDDKARARIEEDGMNLRKARSQAPPKKAVEGDTKDAGTEGDTPAGDTGSSDASDDADSKPVEGRDFTDDDWCDNKGVEYVNSLVKRLAKLEASQAESQQNTQTQVEQNRDTFFKDLGEDLFGTEPLSEIAEDSNESLARLEVVRKAVQLQKVAKEDGEALSETEALEQALQLLHPEIVQAREKKKAKTAAEKRRKTATAPPTSRHSTPTADTEDAKKLEGLRALGVQRGIWSHSG